MGGVRANVYGLCVASPWTPGHDGQSREPGLLNGSVSRHRLFSSGVRLAVGRLCHQFECSSADLGESFVTIVRVPAVTRGRTLAPGTPHAASAPPT